MTVLRNPIARVPAVDAVGRRTSERVRAAWPSGAPGRVLVVLLILGVALRLLTVISVRPTTILEDGYQTFAHNPFLDPLHPAGYGLILGALGDITHNINAPIFLQHIAGICSALLLGAATRRVTGSAWAALLPAGIVLLDGDGIFLEHSIMSESWSILTMSIGLYAAVRALDSPRPWARWPLVTGAALALTVTIRDANLLLVVVPVLALAIGFPEARARGWLRWQAPVVAACVAAVVLLGYATLSAASGGPFGLSPRPGWNLYGRVAQFADCNRFTPPAGTASLCQSTPPSRRPSDYYYMYVKRDSPALRLTGGFGRDDALLRSWSERALLAQPGDFLATAWTYLRGYYLPSSLPARLRGNSGLDPQLDFTNRGNFSYDIAGLLALQAFFGKFPTQDVSWGVHTLRDWQVVIRFGPAALFATTILTLLGLVIGTRRSRIGVLLFGLTGLALLISPALLGNYSGRYTVPMAGPMLAASAITLTELYRALARRRSAHQATAAASPR